jgi:hypothetical protein
MAQFSRSQHTTLILSLAAVISGVIDHAVAPMEDTEADENIASVFAALAADYNDFATTNGLTNRLKVSVRE